MDPSQEIDERVTMLNIEENASLLLENVVRPSLLQDSSAGKYCCIYRISRSRESTLDPSIPPPVTQTNDAKYDPKLLSIGPYHHGKTHLQMIEEHKRPYLEYFVSKTQEKGVDLRDLVDVVRGLETEIRDSYSETLPFDTKELTDLMVLDGCFILTLFLVVFGKFKRKARNDPIFKPRWILSTLRRDLLLLENQVPLFLLSDLLKTSKLVPVTRLNEMVFEFFSYSIGRPKAFWEKRYDLEACHLLDLIRMVFIPGTSSPTIQTKYTFLSKIFSSNDTTGARPPLAPPPPIPPRSRPILG
ncbi:hypothetical protein AtNW77_Chr5g0106441 [Arabidopsis thaliana]|nr:hypothetical protein ISN45_At05g020900 [Arabidopsis thaliana x Arabidopsis arenosa]OAO95188.1 hypothetical protein AXX17_AT5G21870 [Arabidopsis thaliana]